MARVHRASAANGVIVTSQTMIEREPTQSDLGRQDFRLELRGSYPASKQLIADLLVTIEGSTLRSLRIQRDPASAGVQTTVVIAAWQSTLQPRQANAAAAPR